MPVRPLDDIRVLDLTHFYNGPYGTLLLSYLGADVIKIEPPGHGEGMRALYRAPGREISIGFAILNVNKRSITLNLKSDEGRDLFKRMVARADVVAENFAYGAMEGFGLGYEVLRAINPRLIYATGKGYGLSGPYRDLPAFDPVVQAMSGVLSTTGEADGPPMKAGPAVVDMLGGVHFAAAILAALRNRDRTGEGMLVEVALQDAIVPALTTHIGAYYGMGITETRNGNSSPGGVIVPYNVYPASDGYVLILAGDNHRWRRLSELDRTARTGRRPALRHDEGARGKRRRGRRDRFKLDARAYARGADGDAQRGGRLLRHRQGTARGDDRSASARARDAARDRRPAPGTHHDVDVAVADERGGAGAAILGAGAGGRQ